MVEVMGLGRGRPQASALRGGGRGFEGQERSYLVTQGGDGGVLVVR